MACTHKFIRGKNKGETCLRLLAKDSADKCATHSRVLKKKQPVVDNTCLCGNTCGNTVLVLGHSHLCDTCAQQSDIVTCSECDRVGRLGLVQTHFRDCHIPTTMVTNTTMPVDEFLAIDINSLPQPIDTCKLCDFSTNIRDDMVSHATDSHMTEKSCTVETKVVVVPNNSSEACPNHGHQYMLGHFCRQCMTRSGNGPGQGWDCSLCSGTRISPPEHHFQTQHMIRRPQPQTPQYTTSTVTTYTCNAMVCTNFRTKAQWTSHFQAIHVCYTTTCPLPGCTAVLKCSTPTASHFNNVHKLMYTYKKKESANLNDFVKYRTEHVHNAIASATSVVKNVPIVYDVRQLRSINSDIHRLAAWALAFKCTVPKNVVWSGERHVKACTTLLRNTVVDFYESLVVDKPCAYSYATLPPELWELVFNRLDYHNRVNLSETCPYLSQIHDMSPTGKMDAMITWVRKNTCMFQFSPNGYMCASRARSTFLLTDDELHELPVTLVDNPYYKCAAPMRLYDAEDLGVGIYNKYKTPEAFLAERERRQARAIARKNKK